jgi:major membrane immunogen (membrane-anchored lipoprotein)
MIVSCLGKEGASPRRTLGSIANATIQQFENAERRWWSALISIKRDDGKLTNYAFGLGLTD